MRCNKAQYLIALQQDGELPERQARNLRAHLESCTACREAFREQVSLTSALGDDSCYLHGARISQDFSHSLSAALQQAAASRPSSFADRLDSFCETVFPRRARVYLRATTAAAALAALWFVVSHFALPPQSAHPGAIQCNFGHLASFSTKVSSDRRVFASISERRTPDRATSREARTK